MQGGRDSDPRQQTLRATIEWSYELLSEEEQRLFARLSVFAGGCTLEAAEEVCDASLDTLQSLVEKSLLRFSNERYWMLETIREYAGERLEESGEVDSVHRGTAEYFLALARASNLSAEAEDGRRYDLVLPERDNLRAVIGACVARGEIELALSLAVALENFWVLSNPLEGMRTVETLLQSGKDLPPLLRARALRVYGGSSHMAGRHDLARKAYDESLVLFRGFGTERDVAVLLQRLAVSALSVGQADLARPLVAESLAIFRRVGSRRGEAQALGSLGYLAQADGQLERAIELFAVSAELAGSLGFTWWQEGMVAAYADCALALGRIEEAAEKAREGLLLARDIADHQGTIYALADLARVAARKGDLERAARIWGAIEAEEARGPVGQWESERHKYEREVFPKTRAAAKRDLDEGRQLSLDEAVAYVLGSLH